MADDDQKTVSEIVDIKPRTEASTAKLVTADGEVHNIDSTGDFLAKLQTGNIIIDPALAEKATKAGGPPPLTIAEALERGDFTALNRLIAAQVARAQNGDTDGMREEDKIRLGLNGLTLEERERERIKEREAELQQYYDAHGGYRDRFGGYFNANEGTYTDKDGGKVDNYGGYTYADGSYKSKTGDYYDAPTNTLHMSNGETAVVPAGTSRAQVVGAMQDAVKDGGGYDPNYVRNGQAQAADAEHPVPPAKAGEAAPNSVQETAMDAQANRGAGPSRMPPGTKASSAADLLARAAARHTAASTPTTDQPTASTGSRFQSSAPVTPASSGANDVSASSFFAVDSSISTSRFTPAPQDTSLTPASNDSPDPVTTDAVVRPRAVVPKAAAPG